MKNKKKSRLQKIESLFETVIWNFRFFILAPVIFSLLSALRFIIIGTVDIWSGLILGFDPAEAGRQTTLKIVSYLIGGVDYYLIGIVLFIFAFGIYELFISEIHISLKNNSSILQSHTLEELKVKLVNVIVVALIVSLFKQMLNIDIQQVSDVIYIASAILLISISQYLLHLNYVGSKNQQKTIKTNHHNSSDL